MNKTFNFTRFNKYESDGLVRCRVSCVPNTAIKGHPPIIKGKEELVWIAYRKGKAPKSQAELEQRLGMGISSWE